MLAHLRFVSLIAILASFACGVEREAEDSHTVTGSHEENAESIASQPPSPTVTNARGHAAFNLDYVWRVVGRSCGGRPLPISPTRAPGAHG
jgi:hypothetical protein